MGFMSYRERTLLRLLERNPQGLNVFEIAAKLGIGRKLTAIRLEDLEVGELVRRDDEDRYFAVNS
jgi:DNA-binding IclR family transcriptional regulator